MLFAILEPGKSVTTFNEEDWKTAQEAMDILGRSLRTLYRLRDAKRIRCVKEGSEPRYYHPDILKLKYQFMR